eukprot:243998-Heterocapsa_arctica.AAC.1
MQDLASAKVPHRLGACSVGLVDHRIKCKTVRSKVCDLESRTLSVKSLVRLPKDDMVASDHLAERLR